ncbi:MULTISPECIES: response regulator [Lysinibacillus]|uniref:Response regulator n=1 Tax=Lysinibacillus antri TaxID=2498145 RepID=A0A3S0QNY8_9BACI|nr:MULTISPECIES: response regulator [Lysinibacillus]RUL50769.1 response regulator [Lysinibacillus antri]TSI11762.1 response regulator [Lysinibacillus sp. BW-2-10]
MKKNLKVLICDDSILIRKKLRSVLEKCKIEEIFEAENGAIAVEQAKELNPDLIFMDIVMPDKDGIEALKEIKTFNTDVKIVMASSAGTSDHLKEALSNGAYDFIQKPVSFESVTLLIEKILKEESANV